MPSRSMVSDRSDDNEDHDAPSRERQEQVDTYSSTTPTSPLLNFRKLRHHRTHTSDSHLSQHDPTERSGLLGNHYGSRSYTSMPGSVPDTPRPQTNRLNSGNPIRNERLRSSRAPSFSGRSGRTFSQRLVQALGSERRAALGEHTTPFLLSND
jgi:chloride channel 3/4/5